MAKIKVVFKGTMQEVLLDMREFLQTEGGLEAEEANLEKPTDPQWMPDEVALIWFALKEGARDVLVEIARHEGECPNEVLQRALNLETGFQVAGRMSSYGFALKRLGLTQKEPLYRYDYATNIYHMKSYIADLVVDLATGKTGAATYPYPKASA
jgi:hypothetical protein